MSDLNPYASPQNKPAPTRAAAVLSPPQTVKFQALEEDLVAGAVYANRNSPEVGRVISDYRKRRFLIGGACVGLAVLFNLAEGPIGPFGVPFYLFILGGVFLSTAALYPLLAKSAVTRKAKAYVRAGLMPLFDEDCAVTIDHSGVRLEEPHIVSIIGWPRVGRVRATDEHLFLFAQPATPITVPARAFVTEEGYQGFCRLAERLWEEHHQPRKEEGDV